MDTNTKKYAFVLGRERDLCFFELKAVLRRFGFTLSSLVDSVAFINIDEKSESDVAGLIAALGGTVKIFKIVQKLEVKNQNYKLKTYLADYIKSNLPGEGKFNYGISSYSRAFNQRAVNDLGLSIKKELKRDLSLRFVELREGQEVSSILSLKSKLAADGFEFGLFESGEIGVLIALSNAEEWGHRDYDKPAGDKRSGMLPPKLARMMINIALGVTSSACHSRESRGYSKECGNPGRVNTMQLPGSRIKSGMTDSDDILLVDPFCGSGNIALEAMILGLDVYASDLSEKAAKDTEANAKWLEQEPFFKDSKTKIEIRQADATTVDFAELLDAEKYSRKINLAVVTEPYLGEPKHHKPTLNAAKGEYAKIKEMYIAFLRNWQSASLQSSTLVLVFPLVETVEGKRFSLYQESVDEIKKIGYTVLQSPLIYGRDYQVVKREIALLTI